MVDSSVVPSRYISLQTTEYRIPVALKSPDSSTLHGVTVECSPVLRGDTEESTTDNYFIVIVVHGGPGLADHSESFAGLKHLFDDPKASCCRKMVFYDQLGCGKSDKPEKHEYSLDYYVSELCQVIQYTLDQEQDASTSTNKRTSICLLGHSWGGQIVLEYLLSRHQHHQDESTVQCSIISNTPLDQATYESRQIELRQKLDPDIRAFMEQDDEQTMQNPNNYVGVRIYQKLIGVSETKITGDMKGWSLFNRLHFLKGSGPILFIAGDEDTVPFQEYHFFNDDDQEQGTNRTAVVLKGVGHGPFYGDSARKYFTILCQFIESHQTRSLTHEGDGK